MKNPRLKSTDSDSFLDSLNTGIHVAVQAVCIALSVSKSLLDRTIGLLVALQGKHYPYLCWKDVIIAHDKKLINGDVLIDDGVHNLENAKYKKLLFDQPHNRSYNAEENGMIRVHDWNEIYRAICEIAGGEE